MTETTTQDDGPREHDLPNGELAVADTWIHGVKRVATIPVEDRPFYDLLKTILPTGDLPDLMPAHLARECRDLVDARDTLDDITRGRVNIDAVGYGMGYCTVAREAIEAYRDREPLTLAAVGCSASKVDIEEPVPAADRYQSAYWACKRDYGEQVADDYRILSAKYAVLEPSWEIPDYDRTVEDLEGIPVDSEARLPDGSRVATMLDEWAVRVYEGLQEWLDDATDAVDPRDVTLQVLLGEEYRSHLEKRGVFEALRASGDLSVAFPFQEREPAQGGIGYQMGWMSDEVERLQT